jgi:hypothetical protein
VIDLRGEVDSGVGVGAIELLGQFGSTPGGPPRTTIRPLYPSTKTKTYVSVLYIYFPQFCTFNAN